MPFVDECLRLKHMIFIHISETVIVNPFQKIKDEVVISMLKQVAKKRRLSPEKMIEVLVQEAYRNIR